MPFAVTVDHYAVTVDHYAVTVDQYTVTVDQYTGIPLCRDSAPVCHDGDHCAVTVYQCTVHLRHHFSVAIEVSEIGFFYQEEVVSETNHPPQLFPNCL